MRLFEKCLRYALALGIAGLLCASAGVLKAQSSASVILQGTVTDLRGQGIAGAAVTAHNDAHGDLHKAATDNLGHFAIYGLSGGSYTVNIQSTGFSPVIRKGVQLSVDATPPLTITLSLASVAEQVTVEADGEHSVAVQLSPVRAMLDTGSARTEISGQYIRDFTSPVTDFTDVLQVAPGTFSVSPNGIGLGQSNTYFRGFSDGQYTMTYDGIPFQDTNTPTHHSWAFFPGPTIGAVDFDRSPGTASDIGPTNFGGSIHLLSPVLPQDKGLKVGYSYGSFNTKLLQVDYNSGLFGILGKRPKANLWFDANRLTSDGYQTNNFQARNAFALKFGYKFSEKTVLSLFSSVLILDNNTPDANAPTRAQVAEFGDNYLLESNKYLADGVTLNPQYYKYYFYHVPTNFEYIGLSTELGRGWKLDNKAYTYAYYNHQHFNKSVPLSTKSGIDKLNSYNKGGDTLTASAASRYGVFRAGLWYEWAYTNRYQVKADPLTWNHYIGSNGVIDGINFHEEFVTNSVQPFVEYQLVAVPKLTITAGIKDAYYNMNLKQYADNGKIVGGLNGAPYVRHSAGYNSWLPSFEANYRLRPNLSVYAQFAKGSVIPPSSVFDVTNANVQGLPDPTLTSTYQAGSVLKLNRVSLDFDGYYSRFQNAYSSFTPTSGPNAGISYQYLNPASRTKGFEAEGNFYVAHGLSFFLNGTVGVSKYKASDGSAATSTTPAIAATPQAWVANTPHDTESEGVTYQHRSWDLAFFNKRIGSMYNDNGAVHQAVPINPFTVSNMFFNYTLRNGSRFDQSRIKLSFNNLFDNHDVVGVTPGKAATSTSPFVEDPSDTLTLLPGRSIMLTVQFGLGSKGR